MVKKAFAAFLVFLVLAIFTLYHASSSFLSPKDLIGLDKAHGVVVRGKVENITRNGEFTVFYISDGVSKVEAIYSGEISSNEIIATGDWENGVFYVREILSKCHTEYGG